MTWGGTFLWIRSPHLQEKRSWTRQYFKSLSGLTFWDSIICSKPLAPCTHSDHLFSGSGQLSEEKGWLSDGLSWGRRHTLLVKRTAPVPRDQRATLDYPHLRAALGYRALHNWEFLLASALWVGYSPKRTSVHFAWKHSLSVSIFPTVGRKSPSFRLPFWLSLFICKAGTAMFIPYLTWFGVTDSSNAFDSH